MREWRPTTTTTTTTHTTGSNTASYLP